MQPPFDVADTAIEQVIYTWSDVNRGGGKGLGFGAISPRLRNHSQWLNSWPTSRFQLTVNGLARADLFEGWQEAATLGVFAIDQVNVVYRKVPDAGADGVGRDRYLVHALVGHRDVLDLARVSPDSSIWLSAEQCPLNALPTLEAISPSDLAPRSFAHDDAVDDTALRQLILDSAQTNNELVLNEHTPDALDRFVLALHITVPTPLWPDIEVTSYLDRGGLTTTATAKRRESQAEQNDPSRIQQAELADCLLHQSVDKRWQSTRDPTWSGFLGLRTPSLQTPSATPSPLAPIHVPDAPTARSRIRAIVAEVCEAKHWNFNRALDDHDLTRVLAHSSAEGAIGPWIADAPAHELTTVFGRVNERRTFARVKSLIPVPALATPILAGAWQRSAAAPLGFALVDRDTSGLQGEWALPQVRAADHQADAERLAQQLITSEQGHVGCVTLFKGGILQHREWRRVMINALLESGAKPDFALHQLLVKATADQSILLEVALDHLEQFANWLKMPPEYREAFRSVLDPPSLISRIIGLVHP